MSLSGNSNSSSMIIDVPPQENSSVSKAVSLELGNYTILAGENNAGKTNLVKALVSVLPSDRTIYIPAEHIMAEQQFKTSAADDPMREAFLRIVEVTVGTLPRINYEAVTELLSKITATFESFKVPSISLVLSTKELTKKDIEKIVKDEISKKILNSVVNDSYGEGHDLKISEVGQGTQRLIITAVLHELSKVKAHNEEMFLVFEEPEIYLHPKLKRSLYEALTQISQQNIRVIITTHDPYFIELGADQTIYNVVRDLDGATIVQSPADEAVLGDSDAEVSYIIFGVPSTDYLLQLYQIACLEKKVVREDYEIDGIKLYNIRSALAHKTNRIGRGAGPQPEVGEDIKKKAIDHIRSVLLLA